MADAHCRLYEHVLKGSPITPPLSPCWYLTTGMWRRPFSTWNVPRSFSPVDHAILSVPCYLTNDSGRWMGTIHRVIHNDWNTWTFLIFMLRMPMMTVLEAETETWIDWLEHLFRHPFLADLPYPFDLGHWDTRLNSSSCLFSHFHICYMFKINLYVDEIGTHAWPASLANTGYH
jgi:hypothetical protein